MVTRLRSRTPDATVGLTLDLLSELFDNEAAPNVGVRLWARIAENGLEHRYRVEV